MIKVDGKIYTTIYITSEVAINSLLSDSIYLIENDKLNKISEKNKNILKALLTLKAYYKLIVKPNEIEVKCIFNSATREFLIEGSDALETLYNHFFGLRDLCISNKNMEKGVYEYYNTSYHGNPKYKYNLIYKGIEAEEVFEALIILNNNYHDLCQETQKEKKLSK